LASWHLRLGLCRFTYYLLSHREMMRKIFICGLDRSGTTFLASILASLPNSTVLSETPFKFEWLSLLKSRRIKERNTQKYFSVFGFETYRDAVQSIDKDKILYTVDNKFDVVIDHTPKNRFFVTELFGKFSETSVIFIFRDDFDVYLSHRQVPWGDRVLALTILRSLQTKLQYKIAKLKYGDKVSKVYFEELVLKKFSNINSHLAANEICYDELTITKINLPDYTKDQHSLVGKQPDITKIDKTPKERWLRILKRIYTHSPVLALISSLLVELAPDIFKRMKNWAYSCKKL
jgi:hypothetical protein